MRKKENNPQNLKWRWKNTRCNSWLCCPAGSDASCSHDNEATLVEEELSTTRLFVSDRPLVGMRGLKSGRDQGGHCCWRNRLLPYGVQLSSRAEARFTIVYTIQRSKSWRMQSNIYIYTYTFACFRYLRTPDTYLKQLSRFIALRRRTSQQNGNMPLRNELHRSKHWIVSGAPCQLHG